jgi:hypothetical protein
VWTVKNEFKINVEGSGHCYPVKLTHDMLQGTDKKDGKLEDSSFVGCYTTLTGKMMLVLKDEGTTVLPRHRQLFSCQHGVMS